MRRRSRPWSTGRSARVYGGSRWSTIGVVGIGALIIFLLQRTRRLARERLESASDSLKSAERTPTAQQVEGTTTSTAEGAAAVSPRTEPSSPPPGAAEELPPTRAGEEVSPITEGVSPKKEQNSVTPGMEEARPRTEDPKAKTEEVAPPRPEPSGDFPGTEPIVEEVPPERTGEVPPAPEEVPPERAGEIPMAE